MKPLVVALQAILGTALLVGCAAPGPSHPDVKPVLAIRDGGATAADYYDLGRYYQAKGRYGDAADAYRRAAAQDEANADAHSALGAVLALQRNFAAAFPALERAVALAPNVARHRNNLGYAYYLAGDAARAVTVFEAAATIEPGNARTWNNLGLALAALGDADRSAAAYARGAGAASVASARTPTAAPAASVVAPPPPVAPSADAPVAAWTPVPVDTTFVLQPLAAGATPAVVPAAPAPMVPAIALAPSDAQILTPLAPVAFGIAGIDAAAPLPMVVLSDPVPAPFDLAAFEVRAADAAPLPLIAAEFALVAVPPDAALALAPFSPPQAPPMPAMANAPTLVPLDAPAPVLLARAAIAPARVEAVIAEVPTAATVVEVAPYALALAWTASTVVVREEPAAPPARAARLEVANGNGVTGMARRVSTLLAAVGVRTARLTNQKPFAQPATVVQYRAGHRDDAARLAARVPGQPVLVESAALRADTDVRLVLGRDLPPRVALLAPDADTAVARR